MDKITLKSGDHLAVIDALHGANCISLRNEKYGISILREVPKGQKKDHPFLYGMPLLFPANRISGGRFTFEGRLYDFGINEEKTACQLHGCLHDLPFRVVKAEENRVLCVLDVQKNSLYPSFPHDFSIQTEYTLDESGLVQTVTVFNRSDADMPCLLGFHTTFNARKENGRPYLISAELGQGYERNESYLPTKNLLPRDELYESLRNGSFSACGQKISRHYAIENEGLITLTDPENAFTILYENDEKYAYRLIYNGDADEFICLEPQTCLVDAVNTEAPREGRGFDVIGAEESKTYRSKISVADKKCK